MTMNDCRHQIDLIKDLVVWMGGRMITADIDIATCFPSYEQNDGSLTKFDDRRCPRFVHSVGRRYKVPRGPVAVSALHAGRALGSWNCCVVSAK